MKWLFPLIMVLALACCGCDGSFGGGQGGNSYVTVEPGDTHVSVNDPTATPTEEAAENGGDGAE